MAAAEQCGHAPTDEHNGAEICGPTLNTLTIEDGRRQSVADAYLLPAAGRKNLTILANRQARRLSFAGERCAGVCLDGGEEVRAARGVILAAGAIGSPMMLMHSGIGPVAELRAVGIAPRIELSGVGRNLHDHLLAAGNLYAARKPVPPSNYQHSESLLYARLGDHGGDHGGAPELAVACVLLPAVTECFAAPEVGSAYTLMFGFTHPKSRGALKLVSDDPAAPPLIDPAYLTAPEDMKMFSAALDLAQRIGHADALSEWRREELLPGPDVKSAEARADFLRRAAHTHHHPVGTCSMGIGAEAVVGPDLKVRGAEGLYVADGSILPSITTGPVNAAIIAIAERASDLLRGRAPLPPA